MSDLQSIVDFDPDTSEQIFGEFNEIVFTSNGKNEKSLKLQCERCK